jgi:chromosome partitioning protein
MSTVIAVSNNKGGIGKSFLSSSLSNALGNKDQRVLLIDYDSQGNSSELILGPTIPEHTLYDVFESDVPLTDAIAATSYDNVDVLANESAFAAIELKLYKNIPGSYFLLRQLLEPVRDRYDIILIDCPPNLGMFTIQALAAADAVLVPIDASSRHSLQGLNAAIKAIGDISSSYNPNLRFLRAIINKVDRRTSISRALVEQISRTWSNQLFATTIPVCTAIQQAETAIQTVVRYDPHSTASKKIRALADELIAILASTLPSDSLPFGDNNG